mgnify:CR=1 FL=1
MSQKLIVLPTCDCFRKTNPFMGEWVELGMCFVLDEVMLWRAEALIQLNTNLNEALDLINQLRMRAVTSIGRLKFADGTPTGNFDVQPYVPGKNCPAWTQEFALKALRWERRMEFAMEGDRFFDLVRLGDCCGNHEQLH